MADRAVVIGIETYPGINDLRGPCNDAIAFKDWLVNSNGGGLKPKNVELLLTTDYPKPTSVGSAHPLLHEIEERFLPKVIKAAQNQHEDGRLFIFVAGHGFADPDEMDSAALFAANAQLYFYPHLAVIKYLNFFRKTWAFDEVILIMDACRGFNALQHISDIPVADVHPHPRAHKVKTFIGFGAASGQVARERKFDGKVHGIFTKTLLDALENANPNRLGRVTGTAIKSHVDNNFRIFADGISVDSPDIDAREDKDVLFLERARSEFDVTFELDSAHVGNDLVVLFAGTTEVYRAPVNGPTLNARLSPGLYKALIDGATASETFEVLRDETVTL